MNVYAISENVIPNTELLITRVEFLRSLTYAGCLYGRPRSQAFHRQEGATSGYRVRVVKVFDPLLNEDGVSMCGQHQQDLLKAVRRSAPF
jgi:hypothetical protein